jgi:predicted AlkP superfamily pyrophosphatase or phosphodiesterase
VRSITSRLLAMGALLATVLSSSGGALAGQARSSVAPARHVLLISVDGLHQSDLMWWVHTHPSSTLASLVKGGVEYSDAMTPVPSDSFPGFIAQVTGGNPRSTGIYYDDSYNRRLLPPGSACVPGKNTDLGTEVNYAENLDRNPNSIDAGYGIPHLYAGLPGSVLALPGKVPQIDRTMIDPSQLPVNPGTCNPLYPHQYLKVNTIFQVAHNAGMWTAWSDKHPAYEILAGHSGTGVSDLFTPEINSSVTNPNLPGGPGNDWTQNNKDTQFYDAIKVRAVLNEIDGYDHSGSYKVGVPSIFGMNFQSVSTAEKLPSSPIHGQPEPGGYVHVDGEWLPGPVLRDALGFVDRELGKMVDELRARGLLSQTAIIVSAKHGQSPIQTTSLLRIDDSNIIDALNEAWTNHGGSGDLVSFAIDDDSMYIWLSHTSPAAESFARSFLLRYSQPASAHVATNYAGDFVGFHASGLASVKDGPAFFGVSANDPRVPTLVGVVQHGVVYTGGTSKIAEHGGSDPQDRHVPILVYGAGAGRGSVALPVETTEIAPTILRLIGLDPDSLEAVQIEHTPVLPRMS